MNAKGRVFKYGDNVDTDVIIPARYLNIADAKELATHCDGGYRRGFRRKRCSRVISSWQRATSAAALRVSTRLIVHQGIRRVSCVIAATRSRAFSTATPSTSAFPSSKCEAAANGIDAGDTVSVDFDTGVITNETKGETYQAAAFPPFIQSIIQAGGLLKSLKERGE